MLQSNTLEKLHVLETIYQQGYQNDLVDQTIDKIIDFKPKFMITGHGPASSTPIKDLKFTRDYLKYIRKVMGQAVTDFVPFEEAYDKADWSQYEKMPAFNDANRGNAYNTYLLMEKESMK